MEISKTYDPSESEDKWYKIWTDQGLFNSEPDDRESYTVVIPPPMLQYYIWDICLIIPFKMYW